MNAASRKPQAASRKPQAASRKPQAASRKPQAASRKPQAASRKPQAASRKPQAASRKPQAASRKPQAASRKPQAASRKPQAASRKPQAASRKPQAASRKPQAASRKPQAASRKPQAASRKPQAASRKPQAASRKPQAASRKPQAASRKPQAASRKPQARSVAFPSREPRSRRGLSRFLPLAALALLLSALSLLVPAPADAQTTLLTATLTAGQSSAVLTQFGCHETHQSLVACSAALTTNSFMDEGTAYTVQVVNMSASSIAFELSPAITESRGRRLTLHLDGKSFPFSDTIYFNEAWSWLTGLPVIAGQQVQVRLTLDDPPAAPTNVRVEGSADSNFDQLDLTWTAPPGAVTGYDVHYTSAPDGYVLDTAPLFDNPPGFRYPSAGWVTLSRTGTAARQRISSLTNGTAYRVRVRARNHGGVSDWVFVTGTPSPPPPITASLTTSAPRVQEGSSVTVTATLSRAHSTQVVVPVTVSTASPNTAESGDVGTLADIVIIQGQTTGTSTITTNQDTDKDNETFTVSIGSLPSGVVAGSPSSVTVTIVDDEGRVNVSFAGNAMELCEGGPHKYLPELMVTPWPASATAIWLTGDAGTSEPHDHDFLYTGVISIRRDGRGGLRTTPKAIRALPDAGKAFEQFTVAIDVSRLPAGFLGETSPSKVTVTIVDDDLWRQDGCNIQPPRLSVKGDREIEWSGGGWIDFTVSIDRDNREPFTVDYRTEDVTAVGGAGLHGEVGHG